MSHLCTSSRDATVYVSPFWGAKLNPQDLLNTRVFSSVILRLRISIVHMCRSYSSEMSQVCDKIRGCMSFTSPTHLKSPFCLEMDRVSNPIGEFMTNGCIVANSMSAASIGYNMHSCWRSTGSRVNHSWPGVYATNMYNTMHAHGH